MMLFWLAAGLLAALAGVAVLARAARPPQAGARLEADRRLLAEIDDLAARGLLPAEEAAATRAEAGRRLLAAAAAAEGAERSPSAHRRWAMLGAVVAALLALGVYAITGRPGAPDQPYAQRLADWRADLDRLGPEELAAVAESVARERARDPEAWAFLGRARAQAGQPLLAAQAFRRSLSLDPDQAAVWAYMGEATVRLNEGRVGPDSRAYFEEALRRDPTLPAARYHLGLADIQAGDREAGLAAWRDLAADLAVGDPRREGLLAQIRAVSGGGDAVSAAAEGEAAMIRGMVDGLAARLRTQPDDPEGWARLVRAYGVLGERQAQAEALSEARRRFADRPADLARVEAEAR